MVDIFRGLGPGGYKRWDSRKSQHDAPYKSLLTDDERRMMAETKAAYDSLPFHLKG